jgi:hypothetical protein
MGRAASFFQQLAFVLNCNSRQRMLSLAVFFEAVQG